jgi:hypothetical protein
LKYYVFLDANVLLDFSEPGDNEIFKKLKDFIDIRQESNFCTTDYVFFFEVNNAKYIDEVKQLIEEINAPETLYTKEPPKGVDLGEWSIYLAIETLRNEHVCCVLSGDKKARKFFEENGYLPCRHITPPECGVGGTLGILKHLRLCSHITDDEETQIKERMRNSNRRI